MAWLANRSSDCLALFAGAAPAGKMAIRKKTDVVNRLIQWNGSSPQNIFADTIIRRKTVGKASSSNKHCSAHALSGTLGYNCKREKCKPTLQLQSRNLMLRSPTLFGISWPGTSRMANTAGGS